MAKAALQLASLSTLQLPALAKDLLLNIDITSLTQEEHDILINIKDKTDKIDAIKAKTDYMPKNMFNNFDNLNAESDNVDNTTFGTPGQPTSRVTKISDTEYLVEIDDGTGKIEKLYKYFNQDGTKKFVKMETEPT